MTMDTSRAELRDLGDALVRLARVAVTDLVQAEPISDPVYTDAVSRRLARDGATFVTLTENERLRGCIGTLEAYRPLREDVHDNAVSAASRDPRFMPLSAEELPTLRVEVSLLSATEPLEATSRAEAEAMLRPHIDGVILESGRARGTFLPQVWEQLPDPRTFLDHLLRKARLDRWEDDIRLSTYTVTAWHEIEPGGPVVPVEEGP